MGQAKDARGHLLFCAVMAPKNKIADGIDVGYLTQNESFVAIDEEQVVVGEIRALHAQGKTLREIAGELNGRGIVGKRGEKYTESAVMHALGK